MRVLDVGLGTMEQNGVAALLLKQCYVRDVAASLVSFGCYILFFLVSTGSWLWGIECGCLNLKLNVLPDLMIQDTE